MTSKTIITAMIVYLFTLPALAEDLWTGPMSIKTVQVVNNGGFIIQVEQEINPVCTHAGTNALLIYPYKNGVDRTGIKSMLSTALIAFTTEHKVNILYDDQSIYCWGKYLSITR